MISSFLHYALSLDFFQELLIACFLCLLPLKKRPLWGFRFGLGAALCLLVSWLAQIALSTQTDVLLLLSMVFFFLIAQLLAAALVFWRTGEVSLYDALYGTACAYAAQHFASSLPLLFSPAETGEYTSGTFFGGRGIPLIELALLCVVYLGFYLWVARRLPENGRYRADIRKTLPSVVLVFGFAMVLSLAAKLYRFQEISALSDGNGLFRVALLFDLLCCGFALWVQVSQRRQTKLEAEVELERRLRSQQREQYELSRESIALINRKCHDLKHQVAALRLMDDQARRDETLAAMEQSVMIYDSSVKTGNEVLDTVLTEKSLACERDQIRWTCMADGAALSFMDPIDLYTLFGNALDNALESVRAIADPERRVLAVTLQKRRNIAFLQIENYCDRAPVMRDGLPVSTKAADGYHGFGMKSIQDIAERYGGTIDMTVEGGIFLLCILLPLP